MKKAEPFVTYLLGTKKFRRLLGKERKTKGLKAGLVVLQPQDSVGSHSTKNGEEILLILQGKARIYYGRRSVVVKKNAFLYLPSNTVHNVKNIGSSTLRYVYATAQMKPRLTER